MKPLCIDLFCGLGGWAEGFLSEGYDVIGFDVERHDYGTGGYPGQLVLQDVLTLDGRQFHGAACIVGSSPCQRYSYMAMPWDRAKREIRWQEWQRTSPFSLGFDLNDLFNAQFRIQREASEAARGRPIPMVAENVKGAQKWVGRAAWHYGSFYLWGDVPALMPFAIFRKNGGGASWFPVSHGRRTHEGAYGNNPARGEGIDGRKGTGGGWFTPDAADRNEGHWKEGACVTRRYNSKDPRRKAASAEIAKIPFELSAYIARCFKP